MTFNAMSVLQKERWLLRLNFPPYLCTLPEQLLSPSLPFKHTTSTILNEFTKADSHTECRAHAVR
jgi:hypothetical protein